MKAFQLTLLCISVAVSAQSQPGTPQHPTFITGPCQFSDGCISGCCGFASGLCAGNVIAQTRDGGCRKRSNGSPSGFNTPANTAKIDGATLDTTTTITDAPDAAATTTDTAASATEAASVDTGGDIKAGSCVCIDDTRFKHFTSSTAFVINSCAAGFCATRHPNIKNPCIGKSNAARIDGKERRRRLRI